MTSRRTRTVVPFSAEEMFDLVADVQRYPEFVPYCVALRILSGEVTRGQGIITAEMVVAYKAFRQKFKSRVTLDRANRRIEVVYLEGPFRKLETLWRFTDFEEGSEVDFLIDFEFKNFFLQATAATVFDKAFSRMSEAFVRRAHDVYGDMTQA